MSKDFILKKLEQIIKLIIELSELAVLPFSDFKGKFTNIRTAERNFQLVVDLASDINAHIVLEHGGSTPETYRDSFVKMTDLGVLDKKNLPSFIKSANLRNILVHEYDFDEDDFIFYKSLKEFLPIYQSYIKSIQEYISK